MFLIKLAAGLALITFGVRFLRKGLDRLLGGRLLVWLERATKNPIQAMCAGAVTGCLAPSSTGLSLLTTQILGNGRISTEKMLAILLGANVGMTFLANVAALQLGDYAGVLLFLGVLCFQFVKRERIRGIGQVLLSLGFIFLAMTFLKQGADTFTSSQDVDAVFNILNRHPYILCLVAAAVAVLLQSSTATVGLGIGLAAGGALPKSLFLLWIVGTNMGVGITALVVSWASLEGRRLGVANLLAKSIISVLVILFNPLQLFPAWESVPMPQQLALMHTGFNVLVALVFLPLLKPLLRFTKQVFLPAPPATDLAARKTFLDPQALESPSIALAHATREALHMTDEVRGMLQNLWKAYLQRNGGQIKTVRTHDDTVDQINRQLMIYLGQIGEMNDFDRRWHFTLLSYSNELEAVGDLIEKNLSGTVAKQLAEGVSAAPADQEILATLYQKTLHQFDLVASLITTREPATAQQLIRARNEVNAWCLAQKKSHYERLKPGDPQAFSVSISFLDLLDGLRRICNHLASVAQEFGQANARGKRRKAVVRDATEPNLSQGSAAERTT